MKTYLSRFFVAASSVLATALTTTAVAQTVGSRAPRPMVRPNVANLLPLTGAEAKTSPREQAEQLAQLRASRPLLFKARIAGQAVAGQPKPVKRAVPAKADVAPFYVSKAPQSVPLGRELWANVMQSGRWADSDPDYGMYSFGVSGKMELNEKYVDARMYANAGGALSGDRLDIVKYDSSVGTMTHYCFDAETGDLKSSDYLSDYCLARWKDYPYYDQRAHEGVMRTLLIRTTTLGGLMVLIAFAEGTEELRVQLLEALRLRFPQITSLYYMVNTKFNDSLADLPAQLYSGAPYIEEDMHGLRYRIGPKSFYQTNSRQAERLYEKVREYAQLTGDEVVYDLYTGAGTIANYLAQSCRSVIGIEYVPEAVEDAFVNRDQNGITNATFYAGDMKAILTDDFVATHGRPEVLVTDPPRAGMDAPVVEVILRAAPQRIVYVSCNPATQARDLALLMAEGQYRAVRACAVDMFPHTHHVEHVVLLERTE